MVDSLFGGEELNLHQGHGALFQAHNLSLHHLHDLPNESVSAGCPKDLHLIQVSSVAFHTFLGRILVLISMHDMFVNCCIAML